MAEFNDVARTLGRYRGRRVVDLSLPGDRWDGETRARTSDSPEKAPVRPPGGLTRPGGPGVPSASGSPVGRATQPSADSGRCAACGRRLKRPSLSGLGPVCEKRLNPTPTRPTAVGIRQEIPVIPGQVELPLREHQPTLWSL